MAGFRARYRGTCTVCGNSIEPGASITWSRRSGKPGVVHLGCRVKAPPASQGPGPEDETRHGEYRDQGDTGERDPLPTMSQGDEPGEPPSEPQGEPEGEPEKAPHTPKPKPEGQGGKGGQDDSQRGVLAFHIANGQTHITNLPMAALAEEIASPIGDLLAGRFTSRELQGAALDAAAVQAIVDPLIQAALSGVEGPPVKIKVKYGDNGHVTVEGAHKEFGKLLFLVGQGQHVYLYGPPGGGKSHAAKQVADTLRRPYGYISLNPQTPDSRLLGFQDASGNYRSTVFRRVYEGGGLFCIDELDNASPSLLTTLNGCLENGLAAFPDGIIERHADFVVVATGNTSGKGANPAFPDRRPFDMAFAERFSYLEWGYDTRLEKRLTTAINPAALPWFRWVQKLRKWAATDMPRLIVSPRASFRLALYTRGECPLTLHELVNSIVFRGLDEETVQRALAACPLPAGDNRA